MSEYLSSALDSLSEGRDWIQDSFSPYNRILNRYLEPVDEAASVLDEYLLPGRPYNFAKTILSGGESQIPEKERKFGSPYGGTEDAMWETLISPQGMGALIPTYQAGDAAGRYLLQKHPMLQKAVTGSGKLGKGALSALLRGGKGALSAAPKLLKAPVHPAGIPLSILSYLLSSSPAGVGSELSFEDKLFLRDNALGSTTQYMPKDWFARDRR